MDLRERLGNDLITARRAKDGPATAALQLALTAISVMEKSGAARTLGDAEVLGVIAKEAKKRIETIALAEQGGRADVVAREQAELTVLEAYLPRIDEAAIKRVVAAAVETVRAGGLEGGKAKGAVIKSVRASNPDFDPATVAAITGRLLA